MVTLKDAPFGRLRGELRLELTGQEECVLVVPMIAYVTEGQPPPSRSD